MDKNKLSNLINDIQDNRLSEIDLHMQDFSKDDALKIAKALKNNTSITALNLSDIYLEDTITSIITDSLTENTSVKTLNLSKNKITDKGAKAIANLIKANTAITTIDLAENNIGSRGAQDIAEAIALNSTLTELRLEGNPLGGKKGQKAIENQLKKTNIVFYNFAPTALAEKYMDIIVKGKYDSLNDKTKNSFWKIIETYSSNLKFLLEKVKHYSPQKINLAFLKLKSTKALIKKDE
jgi:Leucine Rich repeat